MSDFQKLILIINRTGALHGISNDPDFKGFAEDLAVYLVKNGWQLPDLRDGMR